MDDLTSVQKVSRDNVMLSATVSHLEKLGCYSTPHLPSFLIVGIQSSGPKWGVIVSERDGRVILAESHSRHLLFLSKIHWLCPIWLQALSGLLNKYREK